MPVMASHDYDEKIQKLFEEGRKLGAPGLTEVNIINATDKEKHLNQKKTPPAFDLLTIEREFDTQTKEADLLQKEINAAENNIQRTAQTIANGHHHSTPGLENPYSRHFNTNSNNNNYLPVPMPILPNHEVSVLTRTKIHLENALEDSQAQVDYLMNKLDDMKRSMAEQKEQFRRAVEELQGKLQETVAGRKKLMELRQHDMDQQEDMIHRLQATLKELAASNQMQEQALLDAHERMEILENRNQSNENAMSRVRSILTSTSFKEAAQAKCWSGRFGDSQHIAELVPDVLVDNLERLISSSFEEADSLRNKVLQLEAELNATKQEHEAERLLASSDTTEAISLLKTQHDKAVLEEKARCKVAEETLTSLTTELKELQADNSMQTRLVQESRYQISELSKQLDEVRIAHCQEKGDLQSKLVCLEYDVKLSKDTNQRLTEENQSLKQKDEDTNSRLQQVIAELCVEKEEYKTVSMRESELMREVSDLKVQVEEKTGEVFRLREVAAQIRGDLSTKAVREMNEMENVHRVKADERIAAVTQENIGLREEISRAKASLEAVERQLSDVISERSKAMQMMNDKDRQADRLASQLSLSDRKLIEATESRKTMEEKLKGLQKDYGELSLAAKKMKEDLDRTRSVTSDKERIAMQLRHQLETKTEQLKAIVEKGEERARDNFAMKTDLKEKTEIIEQLKTRLKSKDDSLLDYESRMKSLVEEKEAIVQNVHEIEKKIADLMTAKDEANEELKETRSQLSRLIEERDSLTKELKSSSIAYKDEREKLSHELISKKKDLQQLQNAVHTAKNVDGKAAIIAANMQKEVTDKRHVIDSLQSELSNVYDKLEVEQRENKQRRRDCVKFQQEIDELNNKLKTSEQELRNKTKSEKGYRLGVERLQSALEKAAMRNAEAQVVIDRQDAELSKAHIRRNLDMMDKRMPLARLGMVEERIPADPSHNTFGRPPMHQNNNNNVLQNMLARILATMATQTPSRDVTVNGQANPENISRPTDSASQADLSNNEIYKVLTEVRDHLAANERLIRKSSSRGRERSKHRKSKQQQITADSSANESSELPIVLIHSDNTSLASSGNNTTLSIDTLLDNKSQGFVFSSSPQKRTATRNFGHRGERSPSPVSLLLGGGDASLLATRDENFMKPVKIESSVSLHKNGGEGDSRNKNEARDKFVNDAISDNAEELCRQLQNRLEGLTRIGGKLEKQNKAAAKFFKKQDEKLQQVRKSGKKLR